LIWRDVLARLARQGVPVLNLGGGSCYPFERCPTTLYGSPDEKFIRLMLDTAQLTTVRDRLAQQLFGSLAHKMGIPVKLNAHSGGMPNGIPG
jgi:hypothetical protein